MMFRSWIKFQYFHVPWDPGDDRAQVPRSLQAEVQILQSISGNNDVYIWAKYSLYKWTLNNKQRNLSIHSFMYYHFLLRLLDENCKCFTSSISKTANNEQKHYITQEYSWVLEIIAFSDLYSTTDNRPSPIKGNSFLQFILALTRKVQQWTKQVKWSTSPVLYLYKVS